MLIKIIFILILTLLYKISSIQSTIMRQPKKTRGQEDKVVHRIIPVDAAEMRTVIYRVSSDFD